MSRSVLPSILIALVLSLSACAASDGSPSPLDPGGGDRDDGIPHPPGDDLVFSIGFEGGFMLAEMAASQLPSFVMLGDGRVITQGATTLEFPGRLLPPLLVRTLTEDGVQQVLAAIAETGLFTGDLQLRGAAAFIADAPDTVFTLHADGAEVTVSVYALGFIGPEMGDLPEGMAPAEVEAHRVLGRLSDQLSFIDEWLPGDAFADTGWRPYEPEAFRLYVRDATGEPDDADLPAQVREWPTDADPAGFGAEAPALGDATRCAVVAGDQAETWLAELDAANQLTRWTDDGERRFAVTPRPLLPHEEHVCPEAAPAA